MSQVIRTRFSHLTDDELLNQVEATTDPLTTTDLELELLERFSEMVRNAEQVAELIRLTEELSITIDELEEMLGLARERGIQNTMDLRYKLDQADGFFDIAYGNADVFQKLADLAKTTN